MGEEGQERGVDSVSQGDRSLGSSLEKTLIFSALQKVPDPTYL